MHNITNVLNISTRNCLYVYFYAPFVQDFDFDFQSSNGYTLSVILLQIIINEKKELLLSRK